MSHPLDFAHPLLNAAGMLGFAPDPKGPAPLDQLGAFFTNPISRTPRQPASGTRMIETPGSVLLHTGYPNPGFSAALKKYAKRWVNAPLLVVVHLLANAPDDLRYMIEKLEEIENILAVEVGLPPEINAQESSAFCRAALGELPFIVRVSVDRAVELAQVCIDAGATAVSLGPPRDTLPDPDGELVSGRVYGPAIFSQALQAVKDLVSKDIPVIGAGGVYQPDQTQAMLDAGALAVQVDTVLWRGGYFE